MSKTASEKMLESNEKNLVLPDLADIKNSMKSFEWPDYLMFTLMFLVCVVIGLYFGIYRASTNAQEYLMGGRKMKTFPITMSLIASFISGISILGIPTETYLYGTQYLFCLGGITLMPLLMNNFYLPVFYNLNLTSSYEYLERRFDKKVRVFCSLLFAIDTLTWLSIVIYVPALAINQVTGINIHIITPIFCTICIFYTSLGGLKAVVWTDVIQALIMFAAMILVVVKGTIDVGGLGIVLDRNLKSGRIEGPNLDINLMSRYSFWSLTIGGSISSLQMTCINQCMLQRYLALPSMKQAKMAVWFFVLGLYAVVGICSYCGILIYTTYYNCDPLTTKLAKAKDQLLPLLVMQILGDYPGFSGIFVAGILSASLSSLSTGLNAMAAVTIEDFYHFFFNKRLTEKQSSLIMKLTVVIFGTICVGLVYVIEHLGAVLQITLSLGAISGGPSLGIFTMGILLPWINAKAALIGGVSSLALMAWIGFKAQLAIAAGDLSWPEKPLTTEGCNYHFISKEFVPSNMSNYVNPEGKFILHHVSYTWYTFIGTFVAIIIGLSLSLMMKSFQSRNVDPILLTPCIRKFFKNQLFTVGHDVMDELEPSTQGNQRKNAINSELHTIEEPS